MTKAVIVRLDSVGDVLLAGPAIRAVAQAADVTLLCSSVGKAAADLLPGVRNTLVFDAPWVHVPPPAAQRAATARLIWELRGFDEAIILTSRFQNSIASALLLRLAGVKRITGISDDYPGSLLDERVRVPDDVHEVQRNLAVAAAAGYPGDDSLHLVADLPEVPRPREPYVVIHPGADAPSRAIEAELAAEVVGELAAQGFTPVVTGSPGETELTSRVAGSDGIDLGGRTSLGQLAHLLRGARAVVVGNTGPAHLAASVGTPVVSLFPPVVPWQKWAPYGVPVVRLGDQQAPCADTRARECPVPGHPCLAGVGSHDVVEAVQQLAGVAA